MSGVLICFLIGCMLHDSLCQRFAAFVPQSMEVLRGSCLTIPCSFTILREFNNNLDNTCKGIWTIGGTIGKEVFNPSSNKPQTIQRLTGTLTGNLNNKDCTTILNNMDSSYSGDYYFRLQCNNALKYDFGQQHLKVLVKEEPPKPILTQDPVNVSEGSPVRLRCSAAVPCSSLPPTLTWTPRLANTEEKLMENEDKTKEMVSDMTFAASHIHHGLEISCAVSYKRQSSNRALTSNTHITVHVQYPPRNTTASVSPSATVQEGTTVILTCSSTANPAVNEYTWYTFIKGNKTVVGSGSILTFSQTPREKSGLYCCEAKNVHGKSNATVMLNIESGSPGSTGSPPLHSVTVRVNLVGLIVGLLGVILLTILLLLLCRYTASKDLCCASSTADQTTNQGSAVAQNGDPDDLYCPLQHGDRSLYGVIQHPDDEYENDTAV